MGSSLEYRQRALEAREAERSSPLPNIAARHREAAERWEALADAVERSRVSRDGQQDIFY